MLIITLSLTEYKPVTFVKLPPKKVLVLVQRGYKYNFEGYTNINLYPGNLSINSNVLRCSHPGIRLH